MLSEKLKKERFGFEDLSNENIKEGFGALDECVKTLVFAMSSMQRRGVADAKEIEEYVVEALERYEEKIYAMTDAEYAINLLKSALE